MSESKQAGRVWDIVRKSHICMLVTVGKNGPRARPLDSRSAQGEGAIYFLIDVRGSKDDEIGQDDHVCLVFINPDEKIYLSLTGTAAVLQDDELARKAWRKSDEVWWPERENDENLRVLRFIPAYAELWDGPADSEVVSREFALARATDEEPNLGQNRKIVVSFDVNRP